MRSLAISMVGHGVLVASLTQLHRAPDRTAEPEPEPELVVEVELVSISPQPSALSPQPALSEPAAVAPEPSAVGRKPPAVGRKPSAVVRKPSAVGRPPGTGTGMLAMRGSAGASVGVGVGVGVGAGESESAGAGAIDIPLPYEIDLDVGGGGVAAVRGDAAADEYMRPSGGGTYEYEHPGFSGRIARDGSVSFDDKPAVQVDWGMPCVKCIGEDFEKWKKDPYGGHTVNLVGLLPVLRGSFDFTDWVERLAGNDPYSYEKHKFLEATRERREQMSAAERRDAARAALLALPKYLAAIWAHDAWPAGKRRRVIFELWDECAEDTDAGARARATILSFVRNRLDDPYTDDELAELNAARTSAAEFDPYTNAAPRE